MNFRRLGAAAAAAATLVFASPAFAVTEIQWCHAMTGANNDVIVKLANDFNASQSDYKVIPTYKGGYAETMNAGIAAFRAGNAPHIMQVFEVGTARSISYASPGWHDLLLNADVAIQVAKSVSALSVASVAAAKAYATISKTLSCIKAEREKAKLQEMKLTQAQHKTLMSMCDDMAKFLGFKNGKELHERTGSPEISLKLLLAHYRRTNTLAAFVKNGKAALPESSDG